jgi:putative intracellular protease/amidase
MNMSPRILMVLTSHDTLGSTGQKTGFWLEEFAAPYLAFKDAGAAITLASPKGGLPPVDPKSAMPEWQTDDTRRFEANEGDVATLSKTLAINAVNASNFDAIFFPGGHGPMWDLATDLQIANLIESFDAQHKLIAAVCHGPAALINARTDRGTSLVAGRKIAAFSNSEESAVGLAEVVPFSLEDRLRALGALTSNGSDFAPHVVRDGNLITGQNPASSKPAAELVLAALQANSQIDQRAAA